MRFSWLTMNHCSGRLAFSAAVLVTLALSNAALAQSKPRSRVDYLLAQADKVTFSMSQAGAEPVELQRQTQPALTFAGANNPDQAWGLMVLWLDDDMPVVASTFYMRWKAKELYREFASLAESPLTATRDGAVVWSPATGCFARRTLPGTMPPSNDERQRLTQMKRAAERFHVEGLRLMLTPLYRYSSKKYGVIDGAMFALAGAHDPDMLLLIEAVGQDADTKGWRYTVARMTSSPTKVQLDDEEIASFDPFWVKPDLTLPYVEQRDSELPDEIVNPAR